MTAFDCFERCSREFHFCLTLRERWALVFTRQLHAPFLLPQLHPRLPYTCIHDYQNSAFDLAESVSRMHVAGGYAGQLTEPPGVCGATGYGKLQELAKFEVPLLQRWLSMQNPTRCFGQWGISWVRVRRCAWMVRFVSCVWDSPPHPSG